MTRPTEPARIAAAVGDGVVRLIGGRLDAAQRAAQLDALAALYAPDTHVTHPFAPRGSAHARPLRTRAELREHFESGPGRASDIERMTRVENAVHRTSDPEVVVIEQSYLVTRDGQEHEVPMIFVVRVRDGQIVESRDYADHIASARAFGFLDRLAQGLTNETTTRARRARL